MRVDYQPVCSTSLVKNLKNFLSDAFARTVIFSKVDNNNFEINIPVNYPMLMFAIFEVIFDDFNLHSFGLMFNNIIKLDDKSVNDKEYLWVPIFL